MTNKRYATLKEQIRNRVRLNQLPSTAITTISLSDYIANIDKQCTAIAKHSKRRCLMRALPNSTKCSIHGGLSTGAKTLEGKIKNLSKLKQYKNNPDLFAEKVRQLKAEYDSKD